MTKVCFAIVLVFLTFSLSRAQQALTSQRTITKTEKFSFYSGGTVAIAGAPVGKIEIIGTPANEIEVIAKIDLKALNEAELDLLASVTGFVTNESPIRTVITTIGSHNKFGQKKLPKNFPKSLLSAPFEVNYVIRVPRYSDLEVDGGSGDLTIRGVEGSIRANVIDSNARIEVIGGTASIALGRGTAEIYFSGRGWRGRSASVQISSGDLTLKLPTTLSAEVEASVYGKGSVQNEFPYLKPRDRKVPFTKRAIFATAGVGGPTLKFSVGEGRILIQPLTTPL